MKKNILCYLLLLLFACNPIGKKNLANDLQILGETFTTANWRLIGSGDTSYIYFSQQVDNTYKTYEYKIVKGDSSGTKHNSISVSANSVTWDWNNKTLVLENINQNKASWKESRSKENYLLEKLNDSTLQMNWPTGQLLFKKTLPLSTFLVRARYDFEHGTKLLDSAEVKPGNRIHK